jgi:Uma2 family endonuclease
VRIDEDDYLNGAPELVAEVSSSSASIDLNRKLNVYRRNEVQEYVVWRVLDGAIDWFVWNDGDFEPMQPAFEGVYQSRVFPGLWIDAPAILNGDFARAHATLQRGLASPEHADFIARLQKK